MIVRILFLFIVVAAVLWLLKRLFSGTSQDDQIEPPTKNKVEDMRQCEFCGTHVPESLIVISKNQSYCSQDHADRDQP